MQKTDSESDQCPSSAGFSFKDTVIVGRLKDFFSVDHNNRWPVQGFGGDSKSREGDKGEVALQERARVYSLDKESRWPLQGWCKGQQLAKPSATSGLSRNPSVQSRWPQGW